MVLKQSQWRRFRGFNIQFEHISHIFLVFQWLTLNKKMLAGQLPSILSLVENCNYSTYCGIPLVEPNL